MIRSSAFVAPYWADTDLRQGGRVRYEIIDDDSGRLRLVNDYIRAETNSSFEGEWMLLVEWEAIRPFQYSNDESAILNQVKRHTHTHSTHARKHAQWARMHALVHKHACVYCKNEGVISVAKV